MITITAYNWVPDFAKGLVRDLRVRWALEEAGLSGSWLGSSMSCICVSIRLSKPSGIPESPVKL
jgi:hypothetical protein